MISVLKCPKCGGEANLKDMNREMSLWKCRYCDSVNTMPQNLEKVGNLYNMANYYRQSNHFDDAVHIYQEILKENSADAEAYFGLTISSYGIEYVEDPKSGARIPTCHRTKEESILNDPNYMLALKYADDLSREIYQNEAGKIDEIMQKILKLSKDEADYDIFISYKETDESGERTPVSVCAQDIYMQLVKKGYKVFFARKSLEGMLGKEYEPIIFSALKSAKVMIVVGTSKENFEAIWVKNEWRRFLELRKTDLGKTIVPCYKNMSPYELPSELSRFQSLDMEKIGFLQDLCDGIEKLMHVEREKETVASGDVERLLQNAGTFIKLNDIPKAVDIYEGLTNNYPEDYRAWWELARIYSEDFQNCYMCTEEEYLKIKKLMQNGITLSSGQGKENFQDIFLEYENNYNAFMKNFNKSKLSGDQKKKGTRYLLKRGFELLAVGKVEQSKERFEKCLAVEENLAEAYWGLLLIERQCFNEEQLMEQLKCIDNEEYYKKACAKVEGTVKRHYQDIAEMIRKKCEKRKAKILDDYTDKEQDIKKSVEKIDVDIKRVQENVEKEKKEKKQILEEGKRRRLLVILVCLLIPILSGFGVSKEIIVGVGTILIPILFFVIVFMVKRTNEKVGKRDKEIDILGEEVKKMIEERRKVQKQLPEFPFAEIEDMDIPGEVKREKGMNEYIKKLYGVDV